MQTAEKSRAGLDVARPKAQVLGRIEVLAAPSEKGRSW